jgi:hypothetical protein
MYLPASHNELNMGEGEGGGEMRQGGRRIENEAGWVDRGCREEEKRQGSGSRVWSWKRFKRRGREVDQGSEGVRGFKRRGREVDQESGGGRALL